MSCILASTVRSLILYNGCQLRLIHIRVNFIESLNVDVIFQDGRKHGDHFEMNLPQNVTCFYSEINYQQLIIREASSLTF